MDTKNFYDIADDLYLLLLSLNRTVFNPSKILKNFDIPPSHMKVLIHLVHWGPTPNSKLAKDLCISKPNMTPIVDTLVNDGYVVRSLDPNDRRIVILETTEKAKAFLKKREEFAKDLLIEKLSTLSDDERLKLSDSIKTTLDIIKTF